MFPSFQCVADSVVQPEAKIKGAAVVCVFKYEDAAEAQAAMSGCDGVPFLDVDG